MAAKAHPTRNVYAFSVRGMTAINSHAFVPAIADDVINNAHDRQAGLPAQERKRVTWIIEDFLARYFAPGYREAA